MSVDVIVFGAGFTGAEVCLAARLRGLTALGVVRSEESAQRLRARGVEAIGDECAQVARERLGPETHAIVTFPATGPGELDFVPLLSAARAVSYLSTTGVYGDLEGVLDEATPVPSQQSAKYAAILSAEAAFLRVGAAVLRSPGIYGAERGIHVRLRRGEFRLSGDGSRYGSRIHVEDLAQLLLASDKTPGETLLVGDLEPCPQRELVAWLCERLSVPLPDSAPLAEVHETLRRNRRVDPSHALARLGVALKYPTYREGLAGVAGNNFYLPTPQ